MKKTLDENKADLVASALGSVRIEGLQPSEAMLASLDQFIDGQKTIEQIIEETKERYVTLRR